MQLFDAQVRALFNVVKECIDAPVDSHAWRAREAARDAVEAHFRVITGRSASIDLHLFEMRDYDTFAHHVIRRDIPKHLCETSPLAVEMKDIESSPDDLLGLPQPK